MILNYNKLFENFIIKKLELIDNGFLDFKNYDGKKKFFGNKNSELRANIRINNSKFFTNIIQGGSSGLAESYVKDEFETSDLTSLIDSF